MTIPKDFPGKLFPLIPPLKWRSAKIRQTGKMTSFKAFFFVFFTYFIFFIPLFLSSYIVCKMITKWDFVLYTVILSIILYCMFFTVIVITQTSLSSSLSRSHFCFCDDTILCDLLFPALHHQSIFVSINLSLEQWNHFDDWAFREYYACVRWPHISGWITDT